MSAVEQNIEANGSTSDQISVEVFNAAVEIVQSMPKDGEISISNVEKLQFYALFKQATLGRCTTIRPSMWSVVERYKWDAWSALGSLSPERAREQYVVKLRDVMDKVFEKYPAADLMKGPHWSAIRTRVEPLFATIGRPLTPEEPKKEKSTKKISISENIPQKANGHIVGKRYGNGDGKNKKHGKNNGGSSEADEQQPKPAAPAAAETSSSPRPQSPSISATTTDDEYADARDSPVLVDHNDLAMGRPRSSSSPIDENPKDSIRHINAIEERLNYFVSITRVITKQIEGLALSFEQQNSLLQRYLDTFDFITRIVFAEDDAAFALFFNLNVLQFIKSAVGVRAFSHSPTLDADFLVGRVCPRGWIHVGSQPAFGPVDSFTAPTLYLSSCLSIQRHSVIQHSIAVFHTFGLALGGRCGFHIFPSHSVYPRSFDWGLLVGVGRPVFPGVPCWQTPGQSAGCPQSRGDALILQPHLPSLFAHPCFMAVPQRQPRALIIAGLNDNRMDASAWMAWMGSHDSAGAPADMAMNSQQFNPNMYTQMYGNTQLSWMPFASMLQQQQQPMQQQVQNPVPASNAGFNPALYNNGIAPNMPVPAAAPTVPEKKPRSRKRASATAPQDPEAVENQPPKVGRYSEQLQSVTPPEFTEPNFAQSTPAPLREQPQWNAQYQYGDNNAYPMELPHNQMAMAPQHTQYGEDSTYSSGFDSGADRSSEYDSSGQAVDIALPSYLQHEEAVSPDGVVFRKTNENDVVGEVPGRLALLNNNKKYPVRINEVIRRLFGPENLNLSLLGAVLRRAKNKGGGKHLQEILSKHNLFIAQGKRRSMENTAFTALCEEEAMKLAVDLGELTANFFPVEPFNKEVVKTMREKRHELAERLRLFMTQPATYEGDLEALMEFHSFAMHAAYLVLCRDRTIIEWGREEEPEVPLEPLDSELQARLREFNLVTHGFGKTAMKSIFSTLSGYDVKSEQKA